MPSRLDFSRYYTSDSGKKIDSFVRMSFYKKNNLDFWHGCCFSTQASFRCLRTVLSDCSFGLIGNPVKNRNGPAAVTGDESYMVPLEVFYSGRRKRRMIWKSEDLPVNIELVRFVDRNEPKMRGMKGIPGSICRPEISSTVLRRYV